MIEDRILDIYDCLYLRKNFGQDIMQFYNLGKELG